MGRGDIDREIMGMCIIGGNKQIKQIIPIQQGIQG